MYSTVIVPLDGSELAEQALGPAAEVARVTGAKVAPLMVVHDGAFDRQETYLAEAAGGLGVTTQPPLVIRADDPAECIADAGGTEGSLVVMTSHGSSGVRRAVLGSVAEQALRLLARPMLLIGPNHEPGSTMTGGRMLLPIDGSDPATAILPAAAAWSEVFDLEPWVVTVHDPEGPGAVAAAQSDGDLAESAPARRVVTDLGQQGVRAEWEVLHGSRPEGPIVTFALDLPASLIALTTHGRTGLSRITVGSTAAKVLREARCPVLLTRPTGLAD